MELLAETNYFRNVEEISLDASNASHSPESMHNYFTLCHKLKQSSVTHIQLQNMQQIYIIGVLKPAVSTIALSLLILTHFIAEIR